MAQEFRLAKKSEIPPGKSMSFALERFTIAVFNLEGDFYAIEDTCSHMDGPLCQGSTEGDVVMCPWHGSRFNIRTGEVLSPPAQKNVQTFPVQILDGEVTVLLPD
ncbi:MAG: non-heme iron oxygenase ferredoxin subunit [Candidatus Omnitrophica bacterium]|nr:non-heme iron oxygenase ferredoxin subunit [Candidatus Omnitrophota bacterium]